MREKLAGLILALIFASNVYGEDIAQPTGFNPFLMTPEGAVGILYLGGFYSKIYKPGVHIMWGWPFVQGILVNVRPQIDIIENIPCGTKDGLTITFPRVAVYNQLQEKNVMNIISNFGEEYDHYLITEPTIQAITELCTTMTAQEIYIDHFPTINDYLYHHLIEEQEKSESKLRINKVVVSKPELPENIRRNYEIIVEEKSRLAAATQQQLRRMKEAETEQLERIKRAESEKLIADIDNKRKLAEEKNEVEREKIRVAVRVYKIIEDGDANSHVSRQQGEVDAYILKTQGEARADATLREAEANKELITPLYVQLKQAEAFWKNDNAKLIYFGEQIPKSVYPGFIDGKEIKESMGFPSFP